MSVRECIYERLLILRANKKANYPANAYAFSSIFAHNFSDKREFMSLEQQKEPSDALRHVKAALEYFVGYKQGGDLPYVFRSRGRTNTCARLESNTHVLMHTYICVSLRF